MFIIHWLPDILLYVFKPLFNQDIELGNWNLNWNKLHSSPAQPRPAAIFGFLECRRTPPYDSAVITVREELVNVMDQNKKLKKTICSRIFRSKQKMKQQKEKKTEQREKTVMEGTLKAMANEMKKAKDAGLSLQNELLEKEDSYASACTAPLTISTKQGTRGNMFSPELRLVVYKCLGAQVPVHRVGEVIQYIITQLTPHQLDSVPSTTTVCRAAREMGIFSQVQVAEALRRNKHATLGWDGTTLDGVHLNESHVATANGTLSIGLSQLPDGRAISYHQNLTGK